MMKILAKCRLGSNALSPELPAGISLEHSAVDVYRVLQLSYPKFFKMDSLCQWAWLGAEVLLRSASIPEDKTRVGIVLATTHGCINVDRSFLKSTEDIASPALFVYTLPNIMLGEISIRHGFQGEQLCLTQPAMNLEEIEQAAVDLLEHQHMSHVLYGYVDTVDKSGEVQLYWAAKEDS